MNMKRILPSFILTLTLSQFSAQALENDLTGEINDFLKTKNHKPQEEVQYGYSSYITYPLGNGLRIFGDWARSTSDTSTILKEETSKHVTNYVGSDNFQGKLVTQLTNNDSVMDGFWRGLGNSSRYFGACMVGEEETLERKIRDFFKSDTTRNISSKDMLTITACALFQSNIEHLDDLKRNFDQFVTLINNSSVFAHITYPADINESFIKGAIRHLVRNQNDEYLPTFDESHKVQRNSGNTEDKLNHLCDLLKTLDIDPFNGLSVTQKVSPETVFEKDELENKTRREIENAVLAAKKEEAFNFIADIFSLEALKVSHNRKLRPIKQSSVSLNNQNSDI